jgi:hypothetical protein
VRAWAVLGVVGLVLVGAVVRVVSRRVGRAAALSIHWRDPALLKAEEDLSRDLQSLQDLEQRLEGYRATAAEDDRALRERITRLEGAASGLEGAGAGAGLTVEERYPARARWNWTTASVRLHAGRAPAELVAAVERLSIPEGAWLEAARCVAAGCSLDLSAASWKEPRPSDPRARPRPLPPRPWWPPSAEVWDRVQQAGAEYDRHWGSVAGLVELRRIRDEGALLQLIVSGGRAERHRIVLVAALGAAEAAGEPVVEVRRGERGVLVTVPARSADLLERLRAQGAAWEERTTSAGTTYLLCFGREPVRAPSTLTEPPPGFSAER